MIYVLSSIIVILVIVIINISVSKNKLETEKELNYNKVNNYLSALKKRVQININNIITYDKGYYDVSYHNVEHGDSKSRIFVEKKLEYENGDVELILEKIEILEYDGIRHLNYNHRTALENNIKNTIEKDFYHMMTAEESKKITWLIVKRDVREDRKAKFETLLDIINEEEDNLNNL
jgi:hypothetical protein